LDRSFDDSKSWGDEAYAAEELVAELGSAFLSRPVRYQGQTPTRRIFDQLDQSPRKMNNKAIFRAASKAREASEYINELVLEKQQENSKGHEMEV